jgi:hypothetical protein
MWKQRQRLWYSFKPGVPGLQATIWSWKGARKDSSRCFRGSLALLTPWFLALSLHDLDLGCQWLTPVIFTTQEAEIKRITVWNQHGQVVCETLSPKKPFTKKGWWSGSR